MALITVTPDQLTTISGQLTSGSQEVETILNSLAQQVSPLHEAWQGQAAAAFEELWTEWQTSATKLQQALTGIASLTGKAGSTYAETESSIAGSFSV
jgi:WXG100 family type VII secretion target